MVGRFVNLRTEIKPVATEQLLGTFMTVGKWIPWAVPAQYKNVFNGEKEPWDAGMEQLTVMQEVGKSLSVPRDILMLA